MTKLILGLFLFTLTIQTYAGEYGGELSILSQSENDSVQQQIDQISRAAQVRQENLDRLSESLQKRKEKEEESFIEVLPEDYSKLGFKPYYTDSKLFFLKSLDAHIEYRSQDGLTSFIFPEENRATFGYVEDGDASKLWSVQCRRDEITDKKSCFLSKFEFAILYMDGRLSASATKDLNKLDYYQKQYVRVDSNKAISASTLFTGQQYDALVAQMKKGELARTRFYEWGGERYEETISLFGFTEAYKYMLYAYKNIK